jgi:hypothetical protein
MKKKWGEKIRRKIKLIRTMPADDKLIWALYVGVVAYLIVIYLKGIGV